jgi:hypothetical protein
VLPGDRGNLFHLGRPLHVAPALLVREQLGEERGVVKDDAVGDQSAALRPEVLLVFGPKAQLSRATSTTFKDV